MTIPEEKRESYVYVLFRSNGVPCYVGKGKGDRWEQHQRKSHNPYLNGIIAKAGGSIPRVKIRENLTDREALETETAFIAAIGRLSKGTGPLVNLTDGGEGVVGHKRTDEQRARMSVERKGKVVHSEETRAKLSAALKGRAKTPEHCAAVSAAKKGVAPRPMSQDHRDAIGAAHKGRKRSAAELEACKRGRESMSEEAKQARIEKVRAKLIGRPLSEEHRRKVSETQKGRVRSDEFKAKVSAGMKAYREKQRLMKQQTAANEIKVCPSNTDHQTQLSLIT